MDEQKELKLMLIDITKWFYDFCCKNNFRYLSYYSNFFRNCK